MVLGIPEPYQETQFFYRPQGWSMAEHQHTYFQLILVLDGVLLLHVDDVIHPITSGQLCVIPPGRPHHLYTSTGYSQLGVNLQTPKDNRGIIAMLETYIDQFCIFDKSNWMENVPQLQEECYQLTKISKIRIASKLDGLMLSLLEPVTNGEEYDFRNRLMHYLHNHLSEKISLKHVSHELVISQSHLERLCNREFGVGVIELYNQLRINRACSILRTTTKSIVRIAHELGFYDSAHFSSFFKRKTSVSPLQYRKRKIH